MTHQIIDKNIMIKNIKRGNSKTFMRINLYNSTRYIFGIYIFKLNKIIKTLKIKNKRKNTKITKSKKTIK